MRYVMYVDLFFVSFSVFPILFLFYFLSPFSFLASTNEFWLEIGNRGIPAGLHEGK